MSDPKPLDINRLFEGSLQMLRTEAEYFSRLTNHNPELGRLNEAHLVKLLRAYLPQKIGVGTGFIVSGGDNRQQSPQCDIILYDDINNSPLYKSDLWSIYPIEMVYGVIEVKTTLTAGALKDAFTKCAKIRRMVKTPTGKDNKAYVIRKPHSGPNPVATYETDLNSIAPRFFVFGYKGWKNKAALVKNFKAATARESDAHIHGICNLYEGGSLFMQHLAFGTGEDQFSPVYENGFHRFLLDLPKILDSMVPVRRNGLGFDLVDIERYL
jgi:hypothetical protein